MDSSKYQPPVRRSLTDEELAARVNLATSTNTGVEALMDLLVAQEALRAQEDAEIQAWVLQMEADGSAEAVAALAKFRGQAVPPSETVAVPNPDQTTDPEAQIPEPFSWLQPEEVVEEAVIEVVTQPEPEATEVFDEVFEEPALSPVGTETQDEFESLIIAAAAEEELTALEQEQAPEDAATGPKNILIPSDKHRNRRPISQLFVWLGATSTIVPILLSMMLLSFGLSLNAAIIDIVVGYLVAGIIVSISALAGKRSGLSTAIISRAIFGVWGNTVPLTFVALSRIALTALLIYGGLVVSNGVFTGVPDYNSILATVLGMNISYGLAVASLISLVIFGLAFVSGQGSRVLQYVFSGLATLAVFGSFFGLVGSKLAFKVSGSADIFSKESLAGVSLVVMVITVLWVAVGPNLSKAIPMKRRGYKVFLALLGSQVVIPIAVALFAVAWLGPESMRYVGLPIDLNLFKQIVAGSMLSWAGTLFFSGVAMAIFYIALLSFKSSTLDLVSLFSFKGKVGARFIVLILTLGMLALFAQQPVELTIEYVSNVFALIAALSAGWIGMFMVDVALRRIAYHELSLTRSYGFYGKFNVLSIIIWLICSAAALLLIPIQLVGLLWTGYVGEMFGLTNEIGSQAVGFLMVIVLAKVLTLIIRIPQIRKQEREVREVEARREQLNDIFIGQES